MHVIQEKTADLQKSPKELIANKPTPLTPAPAKQDQPQAPLAPLPKVPEQVGGFTTETPIRIKKTARTYTTGQTIPAWVKERTYTIMSFSGNRALLSGIISWVYLEDIERADDTVPAVTPTTQQPAAQPNVAANVPADTQAQAETVEETQEQASTAASSEIVEGSKVLLNTKTWADGKTIAPSVLHCVFDVMRLTGEKALLGKNNAVTGWVLKSGLIANDDAVSNAEDLAGTNLAWAQKVTPEFCKRVIEIADDLQLPPEGASWLMSIMNHESRLDPKTKNSIGAVGLIQFLPSTAESLGTTTTDLETMDAVTQLNYVHDYLKKCIPNGASSIHDLYMAIFSPAFISKDLDDACYSKGDNAYACNAGIDTNGDGNITKRELGGIALDELKIGLLSINSKPKSDFA